MNHDCITPAAQAAATATASQTAVLMGPAPRVLSKQQLADALGVSARTVDNLVRAGELPEGVRIGRCVYWTESVVEKWHKLRFALQEGWAPVCYDLL